MRRALLLGTTVLLGIAVAIPAGRPRPAAAAAADTAVVSKSIAFFEGKLAGDPTNTMVANRLADRYALRFQTGARLADLKRAEALARLNLKHNPDEGAALARLSSVLLMQHGFVEAYESARRAVRLDPGRQGAVAALYDAAIASGRYAEADAAFGFLEAGSVAWTIRHAQRLDAFGRQDSAYREMADACRQLEKAGARPPVLAWCLTELAAIEHTRAGAGAMDRLLGAALEAQPGYRGALEKRAELLAAGGRTADAREIYDAIATDAHPDLYLRLAETLQQLGDAPAARHWEGEFLRVARDPEAEALYAHPLALYYAERRLTLDTARAIALRDLDRRSAVEGWDILSWIEFRRGDAHAALAASDRAFAWASPTATRRYHRARILQALGCNAEAEPLLRSALADPTQLEPHVRAAILNGR